MDHPDIIRTMRYGYPEKFEEPELDELGYQIYKGTEIYVIDDMKFVVEELTSDARTILEKLGADRVTI